MSNRRAGKFDESAKTSARAAVGLVLGQMAAGIEVQQDTQPEDPTLSRIVVFDASPEEVSATSRNMSPDVIIEPEIHHWPSFVPLRFQLDQNQRLSSPFPTGTGNRLRFMVTGTGEALENVSVTVSYRGLGNLTTSDTKLTNASGEVTFSYSDSWRPQTAVLSPAGEYWTMVAFGPSGTVEVDCPELPIEGPLAWWHEAMGVTSHAASRGRDIRVGVCDTGFGPHESLSHIDDAGAFINNRHHVGQGEDVDAHGSHVCGIIGARPDPSTNEYAGLAPGATLISARVFAGPDSGATNADLGRAIESLSRMHSADLINLSLGARIGSQIVRDKILDAQERGTLCICAAGNSAGAVEFPAAFPEAVAVSALGLLGWGPSGSLASLRVPGEPDRFGDDNLYLANFSCFGDEVTCTAPGAGYISTVPSRFGMIRPYAAFGGTSMASPAVCGLAARLLSSSREYREKPRDLSRAALAKRMLTDSCRDIGLDSKLQGAGIPSD